MRSKLMIVVSMLIMMVILTACSTSPKTLSAGEIGCLPDEITISDENLDWYAETWTATCKGIKYVCTSDFSGYGRVTKCSRKR